MERAVRRAIHQDEVRERKRARKAAKGLPSNAPTPPTTGLPTPEMSRRGSFTSASAFHSNAAEAERGDVGVAQETQTSRPSWLSRMSPFAGRRHKSAAGGEAAKIQPGWRDVNPFPTMWSIFHHPTNAVILAASGILFAGQYTIVYTAAITLARAPYSYNALHIGLVLLSFGVGSMAGSLGGGKYSDVVLRKLKAANGGVSVPEVSNPSATESKADRGLTGADAPESHHTRRTHPCWVVPRLRLAGGQDGTHRRHHRRLADWRRGPHVSTPFA